MKKLIVPFLLVTSLAVYCFTSAYKPKATYTANLTGLWRDSNSTNFSNCHAIFSQEEGKIHMLHYLEFKGIPMVEEGYGTINGSNVEYNVKVTKAIPGWATTGTHILTLTEDGLTLRGVYKDGQGNTGPLVFKKVK